MINKLNKNADRKVRHARVRKKVFGTSVPREDCEEIEAFLKTYGISKVDLIYAGYEALKDSVQK